MSGGYQTLAERWQANAERHYANARMHADAGHPKEWAENSMRKGDRNLARAVALRDVPKLPPELERAIEIVRGVIDRNLLERAFVRTE